MRLSSVGNSILAVMTYALNGSSAFHQLLLFILCLGAASDQEFHVRKTGSIEILWLSISLQLNSRRSAGRGLGASPHP